MISAKNNIIAKIQNTNNPEYAILNPVSGSFDLMGEYEYALLQKLAKGEALPPDFSDYLLERGYAYADDRAQNTAISKSYEDFNNEASSSQVQLMLVPTYGCNLACTYCFQHGISNKPILISKETADAFFDYAGKHFSQGSKKPFITLFGGEPLVNSPAQRSIIEYIVDRCVAGDYELSAVTNGYDFIEFEDILKKVRIKEIQFTLDGSRDIHDKRRGTANKKGTFDRIIAGIEAAVKNKMPVNLRSVIDTENIEDMINLAEYLDEKGWLDLPPELFKTQLGRNYELFECYAKPQHLMTQVELWGKFASLSKTHPVLSKFHRPDFKGIRHIVDTGEMYMASFDTCPACKTEWVFDLYGDIYSCTASCGREEYLLGSYWPEVSINNEAINNWKSRDVKSITQCRDCKYDVICGGGCGVVAANQNNGNILSPDCRPIQELIETGINHYIDDLRAMSSDGLQTEDINKNRSCCCGAEEIAAESPSAAKPMITEGCAICGKALLYAGDSPTKETCIMCGRQYAAYIKCTDRHYICDSCHSSDILEILEQLLAASIEKNPVTLAQQVFKLPGLNMHGPEYHSIVPAILVAAWQNLNGHRDISKIRDALRRGRDIKGGSCGLNGNCGAGVGSGIAASIIQGATPMSRSERGAANRATGYALLEISKFGGPRCCKREAVTSIESFINTAGCFDGIQKAEYTCIQFVKNKECIGKSCPYFPAK